MKKKILITSALPYANGALHFGHIAGAYLPADCYARFERLRGHEVLFISGSDEYGVAITLSAEQANRTPQEQVDLFHRINQELFDKLKISFDHFSRTTTPLHAPFVEKFFLDLLDNGYAEKRKTLQLYSEADSKFLADRYVVGTCPRCGFEDARGDECGKCGASYEAPDLKNPRSKITGASLVLKETTHWFLLFDKFTDQLKRLLQARDWRSNVTNFAESYLHDLRARAITRDLSWGVPVPLEEAAGKVFYVWFDAPIGYISATAEWAAKRGEPEKWKEYWLDHATKYVQFVGKDNIPFHALFFPAMVMGQNTDYKLVDDLVANEFYNLEGRQFSKSEGWIIDLEDFFRHFHPDQIRYTIAANAPETGDSEFTWKDFQMRCNGELLGKYGNLVNRVLVFAQNHAAGKVPPLGPLEEIDRRFQSDMSRLMQEIAEQFAAYRLRKASGLLMELAGVGNAYFDAKAPWKDAKEAKTRPMMETTIHLCMECLRNLALAAYPIIPDTADKVWEMLAESKPLRDSLWDEVIKSKLQVGQQLPKPFILFLKIEDGVIEQEMAKLKAMHTETLDKPAPTLLPLKPQIAIDDFDKLDFRVGKILKAEKLPKSKRLLRLEVDIGLEVRTVLSGISEHYTPEQIVGKKIIVVANLKPATLMGVESQGMVLAGSLDGQLELVTLQDLPVGAKVS